uniref:PH domain-containing protein n=1 Tax=Alexandrium monilatum TaxID=311494 RepID=A0A7S4Q636_9DINO|mmetsp:Transcript_30289/g.89775  ORF Transcript_30289/g.89775 Transcript_30289/m.89775 type:complete len:311 (+) Transcript_30289:84-1016(+)
MAAAEPKDVAAKSISIVYRSSTQIAGVAAVLTFQRQTGEVKVAIPSLTDSDETISISVADVESVKANDYLESSNYHWVLSIRLRPTGPKEGKLYSLQFHSKEDRDTWCSGLQSAVAAVSRTRDGAEVTKQPRTIFKVALKEPKLDMLASMKVHMERNEEVKVADIDVPEAKSSADDIRRRTKDFIAAHEVDSAEGTSLYRFLRTVVQRAMMEKETAAIVDKIQNRSLDRVLKEAPEGTLSVEGARTQAEAQLQQLSEEIEQRLGERGTGVAILSMMLRQNIEKMRRINSLTAQVYEKEKAPGHSVAVPRQ